MKKIIIAGCMMLIIEVSQVNLKSSQASIKKA